MRTLEFVVTFQHTNLIVFIPVLPENTNRGSISNSVLVSAALSRLHLLPRRVIWLSRKQAKLEGRQQSSWGMKNLEHKPVGHWLWHLFIWFHATNHPTRELRVADLTWTWGVGSVRDRGSQSLLHFKGWLFRIIFQPAPTSKKESYKFFMGFWSLKLRDQNSQKFSHPLRYPDLFAICTNLNSFSDSVTV